jgi:hypothetical protein
MPEQTAKDEGSSAEVSAPIAPVQAEPGATHTPGPWEIIPQHGAGPMIAHPFETGNQMNPRGLRLVCHVLARGNSLAQDDANARLITAAPDLLAALQLAVIRDETLENNAMVMAAIKRATEG